MIEEQERLEQDDPNVILIFTDGSCYPNPNGPGGWSFYCTYKGKTAVRCGCKEASTNNEMELYAILHALRYIPAGEAPILLITDSKYCKFAVTEWVEGWRQTDWKTATGEPVKNVAAIREIDALIRHHQQSRRVELRWVKGHSGIPENELVDQRANTARVRQETNWKPKDHKTKVKP